VVGQLENTYLLTLLRF